MRKYVYIFLLVLTFAFIVSCASNKGSVKKVESLIPENAIAVIHFGNMEAFFNNVDEFFEQTGGIPFFGKMTVKELISMLMKGESKPDLEWFNFEKSWACAFLPGDAAKYQCTAQLFVPLTDPVENYNKIKESLGNFNKGRIDLYGDYLIIDTNKESGNYTLPPESMDVSKFKTFSEGSVTCVLNLANIFSWLDVSPLTLKSSLSGLRTTMDTDFNSREAEMSMNYLLALIDVVMQMEEIFINLEIGSDGIMGKLLASYNKEGTMAEMLGKLTKVKGAKEYLRYISSSTLFSSVDTFDKESSVKYFKNAMSMYTASLNLNQNKTDELLLHLDRVWEALGPLQATSFDMDVDLSMLSRFLFRPEKKNISDFNENMLVLFRMILDNLYFYVENIVDVKNKKAFRQGVEEIITFSLLTDLMEPLLKETGLSISMYYSKDKAYEDFMYDEIGISIDTEYGMMDLDTLEDSKTLIQVFEILKEFVEKIKMQIHYKNDRCYIVTGKESLRLLREIVKEDAFPGDNLYNSSLYERFESRIPDKVYSIGHFSIAKLLSYGSNIPEINQFLTQIQLKPGIIWYTRHMKNVSEFAGFWDIEEISVLMSIATSVIPLFLEDRYAKLAKR